jgi:hypothetical protein
MAVQRGHGKRVFTAAKSINVLAYTLEISYLVFRTLHAQSRVDFLATSHACFAAFVLCLGVTCELHEATIDKLRS